MLTWRKQVYEIATQVRLELQRLRFEVMLVQPQTALAAVTTNQIIIFMLSITDASFGLRLTQWRLDILKNSFTGLCEFRRVGLYSVPLVATSLASSLWRSLH